MTKWFVLFALCLSICTLQAQDNPPSSTSNTGFGKKSKSQEGRQKKQKIRYILKKDTQKTLYGNPCVLEVTRDKGFEYTVQLKGQPGYESEMQRAFHNFGVNFALLFRNGPFWKAGLRKKIETCRNQSGDYVGD